MTDILIALTTCPNPESAEQITTALVTEALAACVTQVPGVESTYLWQGKLQTDREILLIIKTTQFQLTTLAARLKALHPYELPEFVAVPVCAGSQSYLDWVRQNTAPKT